MQGLQVDPKFLLDQPGIGGPKVDQSAILVEHFKNANAAECDQTGSLRVTSRPSFVEQNHFDANSRAS